MYSGVGVLCRMSVLGMCVRVCVGCVWRVYGVHDMHAFPSSVAEVCVVCHRRFAGLGLGCRS